MNENTDFILFQVSASDSDIGTNREIRYGIVDGNTEQTFLISKYCQTLILASSLDQARNSNLRILS